MSRTVESTIVSERSAARDYEPVLLLTLDSKRWRVTEQEVAVLVESDEAPEWQAIIAGDAVAGACSIATLQKAIDLRTSFSQLLGAVMRVPS